MAELIKVSSHTKKKLDELKVEEGHTSIDSVIRSLFHEKELREKERKCTE